MEGENTMNRYQIVYMKTFPLITWEDTESKAWAKAAMLEDAGYIVSVWEHSDDGCCRELTHRYL